MSLVKYDNTAIIIVTYNPQEDFSSVLRRASAIVTNVIIVDNCSTNIEYLQNLLTTTDVQLICNDKNYGIAYALNQGLKQAITLSLEWAITLDQDSLPDFNILESYNDIIREMDNFLYPIGLVGISYKENKLNNNTTAITKKTLITSGLLHKIDILSKVGFYREDYFIDYVDFEFSLRCNKLGFKTILINKKLLEHHLGTPKEKKLGGFSIHSTNHNPTRRYYMSRNFILTCRLYWRDFPIELLKKFYHFSQSTCKMMIVDDNRKSKIKSVIKGIHDGLKFHIK